MAEPFLIEALNMYITRGHRNEQQLAQLCKDLLELTGEQPDVKRYIDKQAVLALDEASPWG